MSNIIDRTNFQPAVKWSGSKRSQVDEILKYFPKEIDTYWEPFCGGCSMLMGLILTPETEISVNRFVCRDLNQDLINLWNEIKKEPVEISNAYTKMWTELNNKEDRGQMRDYFNKVRFDFNQDHDPYKFLFIMRTTTNGMYRANAKGEFNNSFHITRNGIEPDKLRRILWFWSDRLNKNNVQFECGDYQEILGQVKPNDFVYLDPPYANTKKHSMYRFSIEKQELFDFLRCLSCPYIMSYDGTSGDVDNTYAVPSDVYDEHLYIKSGNSSFKRTIGKSNDSIVYESLYIKI